MASRARDRPAAGSGDAAGASNSEVTSGRAGPAFDAPRAFRESRSDPCSARRLSHKPLGSATLCASVTKRRFRSDSFHSRRARFVRMRPSHEVGENCRCRFRTTALVCATASAESSRLSCDRFRRSCRLGARDCNGERLSHKPLGSATLCASVTKRRFRSDSFHSRRARFVRMRPSHEVGENCRCRFRTTALVCATASRRRRRPSWPA